MSADNRSFNEEIRCRTIPEETFYERLEFLGDSILDLTVVEYIHDNFKTKD